MQMHTHVCIYTERERVCVRVGFRGNAIVHTAVTLNGFRYEGTSVVNTTVQILYRTISNAERKKIYSS